MKTYQRGVTLLELMITVAIVGILASIVYPNYRNQVKRSNRTEAKAEILKTAQELERCYTNSRTFVGCKSTPFMTPSKLYEIALTLTATTYEIEATAKGSQANDTDCLTFKMDNTNTQSAQKKVGVVLSPNTDACWKK